MEEMLHDHHTWEIVGFLIVVGLLVWKGVPAMIGKMLDQRAAVISAELEEAKRLRAEAAALLADYQKRAAGAEAEAQSIVSGAKAEAARFAEESRAALKIQIARREAAARD
jgi:F-type H+-transporting ATPase subunit b